MEVGITYASSLPSSSWIVPDKGKARGKPNEFYRCSQRFREFPSQILFEPKKFQCTGKRFSKFSNFHLPCCFQEKAQVSAGKSDTNHVSTDEALVLKKISREIAPHLNGNCIYLVGMMGSGKTTIGKTLAEVLGYSFFDSDKLVEQAVGGASISQIFSEKSEDFFRSKESEVLEGLSLMSRLVVATGGGAVIEEKNWAYMKRGITIWLDVPLETLARRIALVGSDSRPLLCCKSGDAYTNALKGLSEISEDRDGKYANANTRVCLESIASKLDHEDISDLTPTAIAIEVLRQVEDYIKERHDYKKKEVLKLVGLRDKLSLLKASPCQSSE